MSDEAAALAQGPWGARAKVSGTALLLVALVAAICIAPLWRGWTDAMHRAEARATNLDLLVERNLASLLARAGVALGETAAQLEREMAAQGDIDRSTLWSLADAGTALVPEIARIGAFDATGRQLCGEPSARCLQLDVSDRDYFRELRARPDGVPRLYGPYPSRADGKDTLVLARPLRRPDQLFAGLVIALIPLRHVAELLAAADVGASGIVVLARADLSIVLRDPPPAATAKLELPGALREALAANAAHGSFRARSLIDGIERQSAYRRLDGFSDYVVVGLGTREFLAPWRDQMAWTLGLLALFAASAGVIARLMLKVAVDRQRIQSLYHSAPCGYHSLDASGRYRHVNATELRWLGCTRDEVVGRLGLADFLTPQGRADFQHNFATLVDCGHVESREYELHGRHGQVRRVLISAGAVHDAAGRFLMSNSVMHDITELHEARAGLQRLASELESRVEARTRELRTLAAALDAAETRERRQLSRDLHDDLGQTLAAARIHLGALGRCADPQACALAARVSELIERANRSTRSLAAQLAPPMLDDLGLPEALEWLGEEVRRTFGLRVSVVDDGQPKPLSAEARSILYRATRELLINAAKHAQADAAEVELERVDDHIVVRVRDSGIGFDPKLTSAGKGLGLPSVRERLSFIGGSAELESIPGDGTQVTLSAPLAADTAEA